MVRLGRVDIDDVIACIIRSEADRQGCPNYIALGIAMAESGFDQNAVGDAGCSIGLYQLNTCGGQGSDYKDNPDALKDPKLNAQIGIVAITRAAFISTAAGFTGDQWIREVARRSGHPGFVPLDDSRLTNIANDCYELIFDDAGHFVQWPPNNPAVCSGVIAPPPPLGAWTEGAAPQNKDQAQVAIEAHFQRVNDLFIQF